MKANKLLKKYKKHNWCGLIPLAWSDEEVIEIIKFALKEQKRKYDCDEAVDRPPKKCNTLPPPPPHTHQRQPISVEGV